MAVLRADPIRGMACAPDEMKSIAPAAATVQRTLSRIVPPSL